MAGTFPPPSQPNFPAPDWGFAQSPEANVDVQKLGDGYESRESVGLNSIRETFPVKYSTLDKGVGQAAYDYLKPKLNKESVTWVHPVTGVTYKVIPESLSLTYDTWNNEVLEITFRQDFNPG
jgi:phage-related protein